MILFALFIAIPLIEITLFIQVGGLIGLWPTLLIVVLTALLGSTLLRRQGALALASLQQRMGAFQDPSEPLAHGAMIIFAGALLLTPGFFTDIVGLSLMVPAVRDAAFKRLSAYISSRATVFHSGFSTDASQDEVIDGTFEELPKGQRPTHHPSGWTKH